MAAVERKKEEKEVSYFSPGALRWLAANGVDCKVAFAATKMHEEMAAGFEKTLRRKSLKVCEKEMDGYLKEFRSAENQLRKLASFLSDPDFRRKFLSENKNYTEAKYDSIIANIKKRASYCQNAAWAYEKVYAEKYGPRQEYSTHLFVRDVARQLREEMEERASGKTPGTPVYKRGPERAAFAQNARVEPVNRETHALVSSYMQDIQKRHGVDASEKAEAKVARSDNSGYHRGYDRAGKRYVELAALREREDSKYHRGERQIRSEREPFMIARRSVPVKSEEELAAGVARLSTLKTVRPSLAQARADIERVKRERADMRKSLASLSGAERKEAAGQLAELNRELYKLRKTRDSLV